MQLYVIHEVLYINSWQYHLVAIDQCILHKLRQTQTRNISTDTTWHVVTFKHHPPKFYITLSCHRIGQTTGKKTSKIEQVVLAMTSALPLNCCALVRSTPSTELYSLC